MCPFLLITKDSSRIWYYWKAPLRSVVRSCKVLYLVLLNNNNNNNNNSNNNKNNNNNLWSGLNFGGAYSFIFWDAYYWREFCVSKWVGLDNKNGLKHEENSLKQATIAVPGLYSLYSRGLISGKDICVWDLGGGGGGRREGLFLEGLIMEFYGRLTDYLQIWIYVIEKK